MNKAYQCEPFSHQDVGLLMAFNRVKKFLIKDPRDLKAGQLVLNVRETLSLRNSIIVPMWIDGKPVAYDCNVGLFYPYARSVDKLKGKYRNDLHIWRAGKGTNYKPLSRRELKHCHGGVFVGTLMQYNLCFHYNTKVKQFLEMFQKASRFQQHCIFKNKPYTHGNYVAFTDHLCELEEHDKYCHDAVMASGG